MTLLVVLGVVVIATILAALYLSLKSGRGDEPAPGDPGAGGPRARGGSRMGRSPSLAGRVRSMADRGRAAGSSRGRMADDDDDYDYDYDDYDVPDYVAARRSSRSAGGVDRSSLVAAGAGGRQADGLRAGSTTPIRRCRLATARAAPDTTDTTRRPIHACPGRSTRSRVPGRPVPPGTTRAASRRAPARSAAGTKPSRPPATAAGTPVRRAAGARPARQPTRVPAPAARIPNRTVTRRRRGTPPERPAHPAGRAAAAARPVPFRARRARADPWSRGLPAPGGAAALGRAAGYDDAPTAFTDSPFPPADREPGLADPDAQDTGERHTHGGRRRIAKIQKPQLRLSRSRPDYDNDPWPSADEVDGVPDDQYWSDLSSDKPLATTARAAQNASDDESWPPPAGRPAAGAGGPAAFPAPVEADAPTRGHGRPGPRTGRRRAGQHRATSAAAARRHVRAATQGTAGARPARGGGGPADQRVVLPLRA